MKYPFSWSYSALSTYEACPLQIKLKRIDRMPEPPRPYDNPLERGNREHKRYEKYVQGDSNALADSEAKKLEPLMPALDMLRDLYPSGTVETEQDWILNDEWEFVEKSQLWLWIKMDVCVQHKQVATVVVIDYKTGKSQYKMTDHIQQAQLYAGVAALKHEWAETVITEMWYVDEGHIKPFTYTRDEALAFIGRFDRRAHRMYEDKLFRPNANVVTCRYCPYSPRGTGACPVGV